jgi:hypothetical protein
MFSYAGRGKMTDWFDELKAEAEIPLYERGMILN